MRSPDHHARNGIEEAKMLADKLRNSIHQHEFPVIKQVTCSIGIASYQTGDNEDSLLARADKAVFEENEGGSDLIVVNQPVL